MFAEFERDISQMNADGVALERRGSPRALRQAPAPNTLDLGIELDQEIKLEWSVHPHFYHNFYVYQILHWFPRRYCPVPAHPSEGEPAVKDYIGYLAGRLLQDPN